MKQACVIGWPVAHSRSPVIHRYWLKRYGLDGTYELEAVRPDVEMKIAVMPGAGQAADDGVAFEHRDGKAVLGELVADGQAGDIDHQWAQGHSKRPVFGSPLYGAPSSTAMDSTCVVCGNISSTPAARKRKP